MKGQKYQGGMITIHCNILDMFPFRFSIVCLLLIIGFGSYFAIASPEDPRTVVIAAAYGYNYIQFKSFLGPLRHVYDGDIVMFVDNNLDKDIFEMLQGFVV